MITRKVDALSRVIILWRNWDKLWCNGLLGFCEDLTMYICLCENVCLNYWIQWNSWEI